MNYVMAFLIGGLICVVGQVLIDKTQLTPAKILVCFVVLGVALQAVGVYQPLVDLAGAGATVPLTGFGYTIARGTAQAALTDRPFFRRYRERKKKMEVTTPAERSRGFQ